MRSITGNEAPLFGRVARRAACTTLAAFMVGCGGGGSSQHPTATEQPEIINGVQVPPTPDPALNQATLKGVDTNSNGVRDDIDRLLASHFGSDPLLYQEAQNFYRLQALAMQSPTTNDVAAYPSALNCIAAGDRLARQRQITDAVLDTGERQSAYATAFAGVRFSGQDCGSAQSVRKGRSRTTAQAGTHAVSTPGSQHVIYVNGIQNSHEDALSSLKEIEAVLLESRNHHGAGLQFTVEVVWNPTGFNGQPRLTNSELGFDLRELFLLKAGEEALASDFRRLLLPHNQAVPLAPQAAANVNDFSLNMVRAGLAPPDISEDNLARTKLVISQLVEAVESYGRATVVAHSQGNLLANLAWARLVSRHGDNASRMMRLVNVANTSEFSVNGLNLTHAGDAALFSAASGIDLGIGVSWLGTDQSLETLAPRKGWTRSTPAPYCPDNASCPFTLAAPTFDEFKGSLRYIAQFEVIDSILKHSVVSTYLSDSDEHSVAERVPGAMGVTFTPGALKFRDRFEDLVYAAVSSFAVSGGAEPAISVQPGPVQVNIGATATFAVVATGAGPFNYQWRRNGVAVPCSSLESCAMYETPPLAPADSGSVYDVVVTNVLGSVTSLPAVVTVGAPTPVITTVSALKNSFVRSECRPASGSGSFSALVDYRACGPAVVDDFELSFGGCVLQKIGSTVTLRTAVGAANSISASLDRTYSGTNTFAGDAVRIGAPDPNYLAGSDESFHLYVGDFVGSTYLSIQLRTNGRGIVSLGAQDFLTTNAIGCGN